MSAKKYLSQAGGAIVETTATVISAGAEDDGKIVALDGSGRLSTSVMPTGIGADTQTIQASEALAAGDYVNIHNAAGAFRVRKADASTSGKEANGFVLASAANGAAAIVYFRGTNVQVTGQVPGPVYLSTTPGLGTPTAPSGSGQAVQRIGTATALNAVVFHSGPALGLS